jgi:hypothetical protein
MPSRKTRGRRAAVRAATPHTPEPEPGLITAYPRAPDQQLGGDSPPESGLSVDADELGTQFLNNATEQPSAELMAPDAALEGTGEDDWSAESAETLGSSFELDPEGWERAVSRVLRRGELSLAPLKRTRAERVHPSEQEQPASDDVDLTDEVIHEASLLDHEGSELGEVESPSLRTDDTHTHGKRRGGHAPRRRRSE